MKKTKKYTWIHFVLWGLMILYLFIAPAVKDRVTIVQGKPEPLEVAELEVNSQISHSIDKFEQVKINGQMLHRLIGWSFIESDPDQSAYQVYLVCRGEGDTYFYPVLSVERKDVEKAFPDFAGDLSNSGFNVLIARDTMKNGLYTLGFLYVHQQSGEMYYDDTVESLRKSMNDLQLVDQP